MNNIEEKLGRLRWLRALYYAAQSLKLEAQLAATKHDLALCHYIADFGPNKNLDFDAEIQKLEAELKTKRLQNNVPVNVSS
jgi:hypothetical protein